MPAIVRGLTSIISPTSGVIKIDIDQYGRVIATYSLTASDIPTLTSSKISDFSTAVASIVTNDIGITIQAEDADLNAIAVLSPADGTFIKRASGSWSAGTLTASDIPTITTAKLSDFATASQSQISADIGVSLQAYDSDLDTIAALAPSNGAFIRRTGGAWVAASLVSADIPNNAANTSGSAGSLSAVLGATVFPALTGDITTIAGALATTLKPSVTIVTPTIASFTNATHTHQNAAGGGTLDAAAIATGTLNNARVNWASPSAIGGTAAAVGTFTALNTSGADTNMQSINATSTDGLVLTNTTPAAVGAQQWSPRLRLTGQGWKTTATAASQTVDWIVENQPVQGTATPTTNLVISSQINSAGYTARLTLDSGGNLTVPNFLNGSDINATNSFRLNGSQIIKKVGNFVQLYGFSGVQVGADPSDRPLLFVNGTVGGVTDTVYDTNTSSVVTAMTVVHALTTVNAGANGIGVGLLFQSADSTSAIGAGVSQGRIRTTWVDATDVTRTANMIFSVYDTSEHTIITLTPATITLTPRDAATNSVLNSLILSHNTTSTAAAGFGSAFQFKGDSDTIPDRTMGRVRTVWTTATDASRVANVILSVFNTAEVDALTLTPNNGATIVAVNAAVAAVTNVLTLTHGNTTSGAGSTGLGTGISFLGSDSISGAGTGRAQALIYSIWDEASDSIRAASIHIDAYDGSQRPNITIGANGSVPTLGVLGAAAVPRPTITGSRGSNAALASLLTALALAGYITDSTS